jgi:hypothetical protein
MLATSPLKDMSFYRAGAGLPTRRVLSDLRGRLSEMRWVNGSLSGLTTDGYQAADDLPRNTKAHIQKTHH